MRNIVVGSFVGFVLAAAFLAACGSGGDEGSGPAPISTPSQTKWSALGGRHSIATGVNLTQNAIWTSTSIYDNSAVANRNQYAAFEIACNVESFSSGRVTMDIGVLPAPGGASFATEPQWVGSIEVATQSNRRATLANVRIPPTRLKFALRVTYGASATARVTSFSMTPYNEELQ